MVASYQDKLDTVTNNYEEKVNILEGRLVDKDIMSNSGSPVKNGHGKLHNQHGLYHSQGEREIKMNMKVHKMRARQTGLGISVFVVSMQKINLVGVNVLGTAFGT